MNSIYHIQGSCNLSDNRRLDKYPLNPGFDEVSIWDKGNFRGLSAQQLKLDLLYGIALFLNEKFKEMCIY